jgi:hypothetical protein
MRPLDKSVCKVAWLLLPVLTLVARRAEADDLGGARASAPAGMSSPTPEARTPIAFIGAPSGYRRATTWDLNIDGALGSTLGAEHALAGLGRIRAGALLFRDANVFALGLTYEYSNLEKATWGGQVEYISDNSGLWLELGALVDMQPRLGAMTAVGYSLLGIELQLRSFEATGTTFVAYAKLRIPIGFLAYELRQ